jgi:predicted DsbA family dithiol-disulfide isomerase
MPLAITVVSDIVCPWCFIGYRRLREALDRLPDVEARIDFQFDLIERVLATNP